MNNDLTFSPDGIVATLTDLPKSLLNSDSRILQEEQTLVELTETLEIAEVNASLNANPDGKNAEARALQIKKALAENLEVQAARAAVNGAKGRLETEKANNKMLARQFAGICHVSELRAAQMTLMSRGATK